MNGGSDRTIAYVGLFSPVLSKEEDMRKLLQTTAEYAIGYLEGLDARNVAPTQEAIANLIQFDEPLPNEPVAPELVLQLLDEIGSPASMAQAGSRFFGLVTGGSLPAALAANWLAAGPKLWNVSHHPSYSLTRTGSFALAPRRTASPYLLWWYLCHGSNCC
jgi:hypothetical protein